MALPTRVSDAVSVVISTFQRPDACERALQSVLAQTVPPREVLVCDNGSRDDTAERMRAWEERDERVRYLRTEVNSRTPATTRNLGAERAAGELIAFLDDDDEWLPEKLEWQLTALVQEPAHVMGMNARRASDGSIYFPHAPAVRRPSRNDVLRANPMILSTALVARDRLRASGGFPEAPSLRGVEDYAMWLELSRTGARIVVLGEPLVRYRDTGPDRLSNARVRTRLAAAAIIWSNALRPPREAGAVGAALRHTLGRGHGGGALRVHGASNGDS